MIVLDACMIIAFGNAGQLDLIDTLRLDRVSVSARARSEVARDPARAAMESSIVAGRLSIDTIDLSNPAEARSRKPSAALRLRVNIAVLIGLPLDAWYPCNGGCLHAVLHCHT